MSRYAIHRRAVDETGELGMLKLLDGSCPFPLMSKTEFHQRKVSDALSDEEVTKIEREKSARPLDKTVRARVRRGGLKPLERIGIPEGKEVIVTIRELPLKRDVGADRGGPRQEIIECDYLSLLDRYGLSVSYRAELARLRPKLRRIKEFQISDIVKVLCEKVQYKVIKNAKDFRKLIPIFLRAGANEQHIHRFLCDPDMTIGELERLTER